MAALDRGPSTHPQPAPAAHCRNRPCLSTHATRAMAGHAAECRGLSLSQAGSFEPDIALCHLRRWNAVLPRRGANARLQRHQQRLPGLRRFARLGAGTARAGTVRPGTSASRGARVSREAPLRNPISALDRCCAPVPGVRQWCRKHASNGPDTRAPGPQPTRRGINTNRNKAGVPDSNVVRRAGHLPVVRTRLRLRCQRGGIPRSLSTAGVSTGPFGAQWAPTWCPVKGGNRAICGKTRAAGRGGLRVTRAWRTLRWATGSPEERAQRRNSENTRGMLPD